MGQIGILQSSHSSCTQEASQAAENKQHTKPLPAARSGPRIPEPDQKTSRQPANTISSCSEENPQHHQSGNAEVREGSPAFTHCGPAQAATAGPHAKPFLSGTTSPKCPRPAQRRLQEKAPTAEAISAMK